MKKKKISIFVFFDIKSIVRLLILCGILAIFFFFLLFDVKDFYIKHNPNWATTIGEALSVREITGIEQNRTGCKITTMAYELEYYYIVDSVKYEQTCLSRKPQIMSFIYTNHFRHRYL